MNDEPRGACPAAGSTARGGGDGLGVPTTRWLDQATIGSILRIYEIRLVELRFARQPTKFETCNYIMEIMEDTVDRFSVDVFTYTNDHSERATVKLSVIMMRGGGTAGGYEAREGVWDGHCGGLREVT